MKYTARHWKLTIRVLDALFVWLLLFGAWLTWDFYRLSGEVRFPFHVYHLLSFAVFFSIRSLAKKEKKKAEQAEVIPAKP